MQRSYTATAEQFSQSKVPSDSAHEDVQKQQEDTKERFPKSVYYLA